MRASFLLVVLLSLGLARPGRAQEAADRALSAEEEAAASRTRAAEAIEPGGGSGAGVVARRPWIAPPPPEPPLTNADVRAALERARPELMQCLDTEALRGGSVRARITRDAALRITPRSRPRSTGAEACMDLAARRHLTPLLSRFIRRGVSGTIRLGGGVVGPPPPPPPPPPTGDARELRDRLDVAQGSLRRCLDEAYPGMTGTVTLRVVAHRDGSMVLEGASLPPGVPAGPMLVCLQNEVAHLRVSAGGERATSYELRLGR